MPWIYDGTQILVGNREGFHYNLDAAWDHIMYGRFEPTTGRILFYNQASPAYDYEEPDIENHTDWTDLHDQIKATLLAHRQEIYDDEVDPTSFEQSQIADQLNSSWYRMAAEESLSEVS